MHHEHIDPAEGPSEREAFRLTVRDRMSRPAITVASTAPITDAIRIMAVCRIHYLPVVEPDGRLVGIVNTDDVRGTRRAPGAPPRLVAAVMSAPVVFVAPTLPLADALQLMAERRVGALPVVDDSRVVGVITQSDIVVALAQAPL